MIGRRIDFMIVLSGFWYEEDFGFFEFVFDYCVNGFNNIYYIFGLGVLLIVVC